MTPAPEHSPLPWRTDSNHPHWILASDDTVVAGTANRGSFCTEDAAHIVKCVNEAPEKDRRIRRLEARVMELETFLDESEWPEDREKRNA